MTTTQNPSKLERIGRGYYVNDRYEIQGRTRNLFLKSGADLSRRDYDAWMVYERPDHRMVFFARTLAEAKAFIETKEQ